MIICKNFCYTILWLLMLIPRSCKLVWPFFFSLYYFGAPYNFFALWLLLSRTLFTPQNFLVLCNFLTYTYAIWYPPETASPTVRGLQGLMLRHRYTKYILSVKSLSIITNFLGAPRQTPVGHPIKHNDTWTFKKKVLQHICGVCTNYFTLALLHFGL